eukprot:1191928-Prorocentrum_minimum.AAC.5
MCVSSHSYPAPSLGTQIDSVGTARSTKVPRNAHVTTAGAPIRTPAAMFKVSLHEGWHPYTSNKNPSPSTSFTTRMFGLRLL